MGSHESDHGPGFVWVKSEGGKDDKKTATPSESEPAKAWWKFKRSVGRAPVPRGKKKEKNGGCEGREFPKEKVKGGDGQVGKGEENKKRGRGGAMQGPSWDPGVASSVGHTEEEGGGEKKPRSELGEVLRKKEGGDS